MYDAQLGRWHTQDAYAEKYLSLSPYNYCGNNPILFIDINGDSIQANQIEAQQMISNTLTKEDAKYVQFDENGNIDMDLLLSHSSESGNFNALVELTTSEIVVKVSLDNSYTSVDNEGNLSTTEMSYAGPNPDFVDSDGSTMGGTTTGEAGRMGVTLLPGKSTSGVNSPDNTIGVIVNKNLSEPARAEIYSHEANGHALMYIQTSDRAKSGHIVVGWKETNIPLKNMIIKSKMETVKNMKER